MAKITKLVDDLDGESDAELTLVFGLDGTEYEIDLNDSNYEDYRATLELLASKGRVIDRAPVKVKRTLSTGKKTGVVGKTQHIREWARENGFPNLSDRGRIPTNIMDAYETRSRMPEKTPETSVEAVKEISEGQDTDQDAQAEQEVIQRVKTTPKPTTRSRKAVKATQVEIPAIREVLSIAGDK